MLEYNVKLTYEAINDIVDAEEYIFFRFGETQAQKYREKILDELKSLSQNASCYVSSGFMYRQYVIYKKSFPPAIIFWIIKDTEVHVLRIPREETNWKLYFETHRNYEYTYPETYL